jgi:hypothetical protein
MLVPLQDREQLKGILDDVERCFAALRLFKSSRREIVRACAEFISRHNWFDPSSPSLMDADRVLRRVLTAHEEIMRAASRTEPGDGTPTDESIGDAFSTGVKVAVIARALRHMIKRHAWGLASYDYQARLVLLSEPGNDIQARDSFNSEQLRRREEKALRVERQRMAEMGSKGRVGRELGRLADQSRLFPLSRAPKHVLALMRPIAAPGSDDPHGTRVSRLNSAYSLVAFSAVMEALRLVAHAIFSLPGQPYALWEFDRDDLAGDLVALSGRSPEETQAIVEDLLFRFDAQREESEQILYQAEGRRVILIPLQITMTTLDATNYIRLSKALHSREYGSYQRDLTLELERNVRAAVARLVPGAEVRALKLRIDGKDEDFDCIAAEPQTNSILLVQVKYLIGHDDDHIEKGLAQLRGNERAVREHWDLVSERLRGWRGFSDPPTSVGMLLATNWFLGTVPLGGIPTLDLAALQAMELPDNLRDLVGRLRALPPPLLVPSQLREIAVCGYTFRYYTSDPVPRRLKGT